MLNKMKNKIIISVIVILILLIGFISFNQNDNSDKEVKENIKVGLIAGLSGEYAAIGEAVRDGLILSLKDENIELIIEDSEFNQTKGLSAYKKLVEIDEVDIIVGADSFSLPGITPLVQEREIPYLQLFESNFHEDDTIFQIMPFSYPLFTELAKEASERYDKIALVYDGSSDLFMSNVEYFKQGLPNEQEFVEFRLGPNSDLRTEALKIINSGADSYTIITALQQGTKLINSINNQKGDRVIDPICDANMEIAVAQYIDKVGQEALEGCISTNIPSRMSQDFIEEFKSEFEKDPFFGADWAYDAGEIIKKISDEPIEEWISEIKDISFDGASGYVELDENGTREADSIAREFRGGQFVDLE